MTDNVYINGGHLRHGLSAEVINKWMADLHIPIDQERGTAVHISGRNVYEVIGDFEVLFKLRWL